MCETLNSSPTLGSSDIVLVCQMMLGGKSLVPMGFLAIFFIMLVPKKVRAKSREISIPGNKICAKIDIRIGPPLEYL